jgi:hypothetical protein
MRHLQATPLHNGFGMENWFHRRIRVLNGFIYRVLESSRAEVDGRRAWIPSSVVFLFPGNFHCVCSWVAFEGGCELSRLEPYAFSGSGLTAIQIPASVGVIGADCFSRCRSLGSVTFAVDCKLSRLEQRTFYESGLTAIHIPTSIEVICEKCFSH